MLGIGVIGWLLRKFGFDLTPLILGIVRQGDGHTANGDERADVAEVTTRPV